MFDVDPEMKDIVYGLNRIGLQTEFSCQGNHLGGNIGIAYISFSEGVILPDSLIKFIKDQKWQIDLEITAPYKSTGVVYSIHSVETDFPEDLKELKKKNSSFITGWRSYLRLRD